MKQMTVSEHMKAIASLGGKAHKRKPGYFSRLAKKRWAKKRKAVHA